MSKDIGVKVRGALFERHMTQKELAEMLKITPTYLSDIINGRRDGVKAQEYVKQICKILAI